MKKTSIESAHLEPCTDGTYQLSDLVKSVLDRELDHLPRGDVSEHDTRYPADATSMRAFLEVFFTRHVFQLQNSLMDYVTSTDFTETVRSRALRVLDIGSGPAVASQALGDMVDRIMDGTDSTSAPRYGLFRITHVLNDTSTICLATGKRMLAACSQSKEGSGPAVSRPQIITLSTPFPGNLHQIDYLASFLGGFDLVILSHVLRPLIDDGHMRCLVSGVKKLERFCNPRGRMLIIQDKFQEPLVRKLASGIAVQCCEQTLTQEIYPPRGSHDTCTYTYYDCLYAPRRTLAQQRLTT